MITVDEKNHICDVIVDLLKDLTPEEASEILSIQVAALIAEGSNSKEDAQDYLDDIRQDIAGYLQSVVYESEIQVDGPPVTDKLWSH